MHCFHGELTFEEGFKLLSNPSPQGFFFGETRIQTPAAWGLYSEHVHAPIVCEICGLVADRWLVLEYHRKSQQRYPIIELYGFNGTDYIHFNRDHIIPRSMGGLDVRENFRPCCSACNSKRGNIMTPEDFAFLDAHPHLFSLKRYKEARARGVKAARLMQNLVERRKYELPFEMMDAHLSARNNSISCQIADARVKENKKKVVSASVIKSDNWVLITNLFEKARLNAMNITTRYQQVDGQLVGPFVREQDRV